MTNNYTPANLFDEDTSDSLSNGVPSLSSLSFEGPPFFPPTSESFETTDTISSQTKKIRKKRNAYQKIDDDLRLQLLEAVQQNGETLKSASKRLQINYSSAKSIIHTFRKEGRILKKSALERTLNFCQYPLGEIDMNAMTSYSQMTGNPFAVSTSEYPKQPEFYQAQPYNYSETSLSSPLIGLSDNFTQLLLGSNVGSQHPNEEIKIPKLVISEPMEDISLNQSQTNSQNNTQDLQIPSLNLDSAQMLSVPLDAAKHTEGFYMNYSNSPLSGGNGNMFKDGSDSSSRRRCQKEFESFSELVNAFQNQPRMMDENKGEILIPSLFRGRSSQISTQDNFDLTIRGEDSIQWNGTLESNTMDTCKTFIDAQSVLCDALKQASFLNNLVQMRMASAGGSLDNN